MEFEFESQSVKVPGKGTGQAFGGLIVVSVGKLDYHSDDAMVTVGSIGRANKRKNLSVGDFLYYECGHKGIYEVRLTGRESDGAFFLISKIAAPIEWDKISLEDKPLIDTHTLRTNNPISDDDARLIRQKLRQLEDELNKQFSINEGHNLFVSERLRYLDDALRRQGAMDWVHTAMGVFVSIALALSISAANNDKFWALIQRVFRDSIGLFLNVG